MRIAITDHAVQRFQERVEGAGSFDADSVRELIRNLVLEGFREGAVRGHPQHYGKRIVPFTSGPSVLYLSLGPNETSVPADFAVVNVMFEKELGGKIEIGATLGDAFPTITKMDVTKRAPRFIAVLRRDGVEDHYDIGGVRELRRALKDSAESVQVYELLEESEIKKLL